jgi:hypothetical protein
MNDIVLAVTDKEVTGLLNNLWNFALTVMNSTMSVIMDTPHKLLGGITIAIIAIWLWRKL